MSRSTIVETSRNDYNMLLSTLPLKDPADLFTYKAKPNIKNTIHPFENRSIRANNSATSPNLYVCHDMRGNYLNDRIDNGAKYENAFQLVHWEIIDHFCYFSHHLITIPPISWINACKHHGTLVSGTFITEWEIGSSYCSELFGTKLQATTTAELLLQIAKGKININNETFSMDPYWIKEDYCLDGWLINIENSLNPISEVPNLIHFLDTLTKGMHLYQPYSKVIWYDAVTVAGVLAWQDALTENNKPFFDVCDGIFVNYTWKDTSLARTAELVEKERFKDVYFGCDVFGRGTPGRSGFDCKIPLKILRQYGYSAALFAPGWVLETQVDATGSFMKVQTQNDAMTLRFWTELLEGWHNPLSDESIDSNNDNDPNLSQLLKDSHSNKCIMGLDSAEELSTLTDTSNQKAVTLSFSQASGKYVFIYGHRYNHWETAVDTSPLSTPSSIRNSIDDQSDFYDLSLQDIRFNVALLNYSTSSSASKKIACSSNSIKVEEYEATDDYVIVEREDIFDPVSVSKSTAAVVEVTATEARNLLISSDESDIKFQFEYDYGFDGTSCLKAEGTLGYQQIMERSIEPFSTITATSGEMICIRIATSKLIKESNMDFVFVFEMLSHDCHAFRSNFKGTDSSTDIGIGSESCRTFSVRTITTPSKIGIRDDQDPITSSSDTRDVCLFPNDTEIITPTNCNGSDIGEGDQENSLCVWQMNTYYVNLPDFAVGGTEQRGWSLRQILLQCSTHYFDDDASATPPPTTSTTINFSMFLGCIAVGGMPGMKAMDSSNVTFPSSHPVTWPSYWNSNSINSLTEISSLPPTPCAIPIPTVAAAASSSNATPPTSSSSSSSSSSAVVSGNSHRMPFPSTLLLSQPDHHHHYYYYPLFRSHYFNQIAINDFLFSEDKLWVSFTLLWSSCGSSNSDYGGGYFPSQSIDNYLRCIDMFVYLPQQHDENNNNNEHHGDRWLLIGRTRSHQAHRVEVRVTYLHFEQSLPFSNIIQEVTATVSSVSYITMTNNSNEKETMEREESFIQSENQLTSSVALTRQPHILLLLQPNSIYFTPLEPLLLRIKLPC